MSPSPRIVAVTGASGFIGTRLLLQLENNPEVGKIVAFDQRPLPFPIHNIAFYRGNISIPKVAEDTETGRNSKKKKVEDDPQEKPVPVADLMRQHRVDTLVHLACTFSHTDTYQDWASESQDNLHILQCIEEYCIAARVKHVIFLSSHRVYGTFPDNPIPVSESGESRTRPDDFLGHASAASDMAMAEFKAREDLKGEGSGIKVTILRCCPVLGYSDDHFRAEHVFPHHFLGAGENPPFQFLHEVDMAHLLEKVIQREQEGIFNVAGEGVVFLSELSEITRRKLTQLPIFLARPAAFISARMGKSGLGNWNLNTSRYPIIMSTGKIKQTLNYRFDYTSMEALNAFVNYNGL